MSNEKEFLQRAVTEWFHAGGLVQPANSSGVTEFEGKSYVVLRNVNGVLAVYRIRTNGTTLKRLQRWPSEIEKW